VDWMKIMVPILMLELGGLIWFLSAVASRLKGIDGRMAAGETRFETHDNKIRALENSFSEFKGLHGQLVHECTDVVKAHSALAAALSSLNQRISTLEGTCRARHDAWKKGEGH
jgi:hypothetical protein